MKLVTVEQRNQKLIIRPKCGSICITVTCDNGAVCINSDKEDVQNFCCPVAISSILKLIATTIVQHSNIIYEKHKRSTVRLQTWYKNKICLYCSKAVKRLVYENTPSDAMQIARRFYAAMGLVGAQSVYNFYYCNYDKLANDHWFERDILSGQLGPVYYAGIYCMRGNLLNDRDWRQRWYDELKIASTKPANRIMDRLPIRTPSDAIINGLLTTYHLTQIDISDAGYTSQRLIGSLIYYVHLCRRYLAHVVVRPNEARGLRNVILAILKLTNRQLCKLLRSKFYMRLHSYVPILNIAIQIADYIRNNPVYDGTSLERIIDGCIEWHQETIREQYKGKYVEFTSPPFHFNSNDVVYLSSTDALVNEAAKMQHCVASYVPRCIQKQSYIFHVKYKGDHATVEMAPDGELVQAFGPRNTVNAASKWFRRNYKSLLIYEHK